MWDYGKVGLLKLAPLYTFNHMTRAFFDGVAGEVEVSMMTLFLD
ncbi:17582_t:CDS:1, partial [Funneliformis geosporum]